MRLIIPGLPHTRTTGIFSHCAYTSKIRRWAQMLSPLGYECVHLGVEEADSPGWAAQVSLMSREEQAALMGYDPGQPTAKFIGDAADVSNPVYREFNRRLKDWLDRHAEPDDVLCAPFGHGHQQGFAGREHQVIETGIGYPTCFTGYRIYESYAWFHWHLGKEDRQAWISEWVIPNYFDLSEWPLRKTKPENGEYVLFFGRITASKGINVVWNLARMRPDLRFVLCGQGDPSPWMTEPNLEYHPPVHGMDRAKMFHGAKVVLVPTEYLEPFGGVAVEAMLTGTPVLTSAHGAFAETVKCPKCRCHTAGDWLAGLDVAMGKNPSALHEWAASRYSLQAVAPQYDRIFKQVPGIRRDGWNAGGLRA